MIPASPRSQGYQLCLGPGYGVTGMRFGGKAVISLPALSGMWPADSPASQHARLSLEPLNRCRARSYSCSTSCMEHRRRVMAAIVLHRGGSVSGSAPAVRLMWNSRRSFGSLVLLAVLAFLCLLPLEGSSRPNLGFTWSQNSFMQRQHLAIPEPSTRRFLQSVRARPVRERRWSEYRSPSGTEATDPRVLTSRIKSTSSTAELFALLQKEVDAPYFNEFHMSAIFTQTTADFEWCHGYSVAKTCSQIAQHAQQAHDFTTRSWQHTLVAFGDLPSRLSLATFEMKPITRG